MYKTEVKIFLVVGLVCLSFLTIAQTKSPFTSRGIGDISDLSLSNNQSMGGLGLSNGNYWYLNNMNPALLPYNSLTVFAAGVEMERRNISDGTNQETNSGGRLGYLATAFPIMPGKWTSSVGLAPYSRVDYKFTLPSQSVPNAPDSVTANITEQGSGGFSQFYWSNGVALTRSFYVGIKATYIFSSIETQFSNQLNNTGAPVTFVPSVKNRTSVSDFMFQGSIAYRKDSIFNNKIGFKMGATYDLSSNIKASQLESTELQFNGTAVTNPDTLVNDESGSISLPWALGVGFSFNNGSKWLAGIDVRYQPWSEYKNFNGGNDGLEDSYKIVLGGEFTPDASSVNNYFERVTYRVGFSYENTPYMINGKQVKDFGINFGWSLPVSRFSSLDMAFNYGMRGSASETQIEEDYYGFTLGVTFNDQWFIKRKYD